MKNLKNVLLVFTLVAMVLFVGFPSNSTSAQTTPITASMKIGSRGNEVTKLQTLLAQNPIIYPQGLVTGYFGPLTKEAVVQFQIAANIGVDGIVGPNTRSKLNEYINDGIGPDFLNPTVYSDSIVTSSNSATITWSTNEPARGYVYYDTVPIRGGDTEDAPYNFTLSGSVASDIGNTTNHVVTLNNLTPNTTYYYHLASIDKYGNATITLKTTFATNQ